MHFQIRYTPHHYATKCIKTNLGDAFDIRFRRMGETEGLLSTGEAVSQFLNQMFLPLAVVLYVGFKHLPTSILKKLK